MQNQIRHLFISPGHNYFGRHGQPAGENPVTEVGEIECVAGRGIRGDRFFDFKPGSKGQITFFAWENLLRMWKELRVPDPQRDPAATRRNVITEGLDLNTWIGSEFELQGVRFLGTEECRPCSWMNGAIHPAAEEWMRGRGGVRAEILSDGWLRSDAGIPTLAGVLIAGGKSARMGRDKARIEIEGLPLWQRQLDLLSSVCAAVAVSAPERPAWQPDGQAFVADPPAARGPLAGLLAALEWADSRGASHVLALAVDLPRMTPGILRHLVARCRRGRGSVPRGLRGFEPLCAVYPVEARPLLQKSADRGEWKLQDAVARLVSEGLLIAHAVPPEDEHVFFNLNTTEDLSTLGEPAK